MEYDLRTGWEFKVVETRSVLNEQLMGWHYAQAENSNCGCNEVSIELTADGMALHTHCEFKVVAQGQYWMND